MTREQAQQFVNIYNELLKISTKGEDTLIMANILTSMQQLANSIEVIEEPKIENTETAEGE